MADTPGIVYSTDHGSMCPACSMPLKECICREGDSHKRPDSHLSGVVGLRYETKGRRGKGVTLITGLPLSLDGLEELAKKLKQRLGTGGSVKDYTIELQGDHRGQAARELRAQGFLV